jgi:hypothetical protein
MKLRPGEVVWIRGMLLDIWASLRRYADRVRQLDDSLSTSSRNWMATSPSEHLKIRLVPNTDGLFERCVYYNSEWNS